MVKKTTSNLQLVDRSDEVEAQWKKAEMQWRIPADELRQRVHALRGELESYRSEMEGVPFDIVSGSFSPPSCLDASDRKYTLELVEALDNRVNGAFEKLDSFAKEHGYEHSDFNARLFSLKNNTAETAFKIGVFAGAIFAHCPNEKIDQFERGLVISLTSQHGLVKSD